MLKTKIKTMLGSCVQPFMMKQMAVNKNIILTYHRVAEDMPERLHDPAMFVKTATLEMHLREIMRYYDIVPLDTIVRPGPLPRKQCAITFDDGWLDNYVYAYPILKTLGIPATIFLPVNLIGSERSFWFQNVIDHAFLAKNRGLYEQFIKYYSQYAPAWKNKGVEANQVDELIASLKGVKASLLDEITKNAYMELALEDRERSDTMNWDQIREMSNNGITFGSHGLHHNIFTTLDHHAKCQEIAGSMDVLQKSQINLSRFLSYPNGNWDSETVLLAKNAGYKGAVTTQIGFNTASTDPFLLKRISMHEDISDTPSLFWFRIFQAFVMNPRNPTPAAS